MNKFGPLVESVVTDGTLTLTGTMIIAGISFRSNGAAGNENVWTVSDGDGNIIVEIMGLEPFEIKIPFITNGLTITETHDAGTVETTVVHSHPGA